LTAGEAAKVLGLAPSTLAKLRLSGNGPVYCKLGRRVVYRREEAPSDLFGGGHRAAARHP
jgi:Helix-turn-helix domain